ncbi:MAG: hypothetical protein K2X43_13210 [Hyphomonadaceae bacterium]|nr:hypothetical protein [Hyphomonadaceae bacterium]
MSAQQSTPAALPPAGHGDDNDGTHHPTEGAAGGEPAPLLTTTAELANLLANGQWSDGAHGTSADVAETSAYEGHVALALDTGVLPDIDSTLDLLTSSHHLFDVPALDVSSASVDDASST